MIIWSGLGILIPVIVIFGTIAGGVLASILGFPDQGLGIGFLIAAVINWVLWRSMGKKPGKVLMDPQTGQQVVLKKSHSLFFIPGRFWTVIMVLLGLLAFSTMSGNSEREAKEKATAGYAEFTAANALIGTNKSGVTHGSSDAAKESAGAFSLMMKSLTEMAFTGGSKKNLMTGGEFITYCQDGADEIVFLCHVPSLRSYKTQETKDTLAEIAWMSATNAAKALDPDGRKTLWVGLRGISLYGSIQKGPNSEEAKPKSLSTSSKSVFYPAFVSKAAASENQPVQADPVIPGDTVVPEAE